MYNDYFKLVISFFHGLLQTFLPLSYKPYAQKILKQKPWLQIYICSQGFSFSSKFRITEAQTLATNIQMLQNSVNKDFSQDSSIVIY